jgi:hypothetical protein
MECSRLKKEVSLWDTADLFFLSDTLRRGMPLCRVAGFLSRSESEVRAKAQELNVFAADGDVVPARRKIA